MITIIHGDDVISSRLELTKLKEQHKDKEIVILTAEKFSIKEIYPLLQTDSLFSTNRLIILENLIISSDKKQKDGLLEFFQKFTSNDPIIVWESKEISSVLIKKYFPKAKILTCKIPQMLFRFLDNIGKDNNNAILSQFHSLVKTHPAEFIYTMLLRQIRLLITLKDSSFHEHGLLSWQVGKLSLQARLFSYDELLVFYRQLLHVDYKIKSGQTPFSMKESLDIFFAGF